MKKKKKPQEKESGLCRPSSLTRSVCNLLCLGSLSFTCLALTGLVHRLVSPSRHTNFATQLEISGKKTVYFNYFSLFVSFFSFIILLKDHQQNKLIIQILSKSFFLLLFFLLQSHFNCYAIKNCPALLFVFSI